MAEVLLEQVVSRLAEDRLARQVALAAAAERNAALLGQDPPETTLRDVAEAAQWRYIEEVVRPRLRVAANPAATCEDASTAIGAIFNATRQRSLLGLSDEEAPSALDQAFEALAEEAIPLVEAACRRDAARECRKSGDIADVVRRALTEQRSRALLGGQDDGEGPIPEFYQRILRWCAVYELTFVSKLKIAAENYTITPKIEGHLTLRLDEEVVDPSIWPPPMSGQTEGGLNPFLVSVGCTSRPRMTCAPGAVGMQPTRARITKFELGGTQRRRVGGLEHITNVPAVLELHFQASPMILDFIVPGPNGSQIHAALEVYSTPFNTAHEAARDGESIKITDWQRANHPLLWKRTYAGERRKEGATYSDSTDFELVHKPDPEPAQP